MDRHVAKATLNVDSLDGFAKVTTDRLQRVLYITLHLWPTLYTRTRLSRYECGPADLAYLLSMHVIQVAKNECQFLIRT